MKKKLLSVFLLSITLASQAQKIQAGVTGSYNMSMIKGDGMSDALQPGFSAGFYAEKQLAKRWSFQPGLTFSSFNVLAGTNFKSVYPETAYVYLKRNVALNYLSLPLLLNYRLDDNWKLTFGPQYNILLSRTENLMADDRRSFKKNDLRMMGGLQLELASLRIYGRYSYGVNNLNNINSYHQWTSHSIEFGAGWRLF